ncbi:MAG TPA: penicillin-binding transpeptidase domain-containing protein [Caulobacteraceae bacterium]|jgi:beta-lactamase class D|nr:penicillin-binding transpeptidase domain-containing protein [Caulobacteraceae bacterium]
MQRLARAATCGVLSAALLAGCTQRGGHGPAGISQDKLNAAVDQTMGGGETCVAIFDTRSGRGLYQYGNAGVCMRGLPPCQTFEIASDLVGLNLGVVTPVTVFKWDHTPQPVKAWEGDADMARAFTGSIGWWDQRLAQSIGHDRYVQQLKALDYGTHDPAGPIQSFWMGSKYGGGLWISTRQQAEFLRRLFGGQAPVKPDAVAQVAHLMVDETRVDAQGKTYVMSGKAAQCPSVSDGSRQVSWWIGRLQAPDRDIAFAASIEAADAPPGIVLQGRVKAAFAEAGLWPSGA